MASAAMRAREKHGVIPWGGLVGGDRRGLQRVVQEGQHDAMRAMVRLLASRDAAVRCAGAHAIRNVTDNYDSTCDLVQQVDGGALLDDPPVQDLVLSGPRDLAPNPPGFKDPRVYPGNVFFLSLTLSLKFQSLCLDKLLAKTVIAFIKPWQ